MYIRRAENKDIGKIEELLYQVNDIHFKGRPDLFIKDGCKYLECELMKMISCPDTPIFVAVDDDVVGYAFCVIINQTHGHSIKDIRTLFIDDFCIDEKYRGMHVGMSLYNYVVDYARHGNFYNLTLNVWTCNPSAIKFYERMGLKPQKIVMEQIL